MFEGARSFTELAYAVLNVRSSPLAVPSEFVAEIRKWYSVFATRPAVIEAETECLGGVSQSTTSSRLGLARVPGLSA
jgi:hypothetical protein